MEIRASYSYEIPITGCRTLNDTPGVKPAPTNSQIKPEVLRVIRIHNNHILLL